LKCARPKGKKEKIRGGKSQNLSGTVHLQLEKTAASSLYNGKETVKKFWPDSKQAGSCEEKEVNDKNKSGWEVGFVWAEEDGSRELLLLSKNKGEKLKRFKKGRRANLLLKRVHFSGSDERAKKNLISYPSQQ